MADYAREIVAKDIVEGDDNRGVDVGGLDWVTPLLTGKFLSLARHRGPLSVWDLEINPWFGLILLF